ncbi:protein phosphatase 2C domain-containing protein [Virgibacillus flavescens]|uniref:protein phosphatase 2C domain-containing protein n=1 Tax=Virgibacillus flavescens TaxID=1611422 RepID=UPI003D32E708
MKEYRWVGSQKDFVDEISTVQLNNMILGRFGGNASAGQHKNEDGCLIWSDQENDWEFACILDAHNTAESAELVLAALESMKDSIQISLKLNTGEAFRQVHEMLLDKLCSQTFKDRCQHVQGETACLFVIRKENYLWWFSIGDCILYLNHPELAALGEYQQNHRSFYEWVGQESTFNKRVPCYSAGIKELRTGENHILLTTDGLVECPNTKFDSPEEIFSMFDGVQNSVGVHDLLREIQQKNVRDSTTIISWTVTNNQIATIPSDFRRK